MEIDEAYDLLEQAMQQPTASNLRCELLEGALRISESLGHERCMVRVLYELESAYLVVGRTKESIAVFSRLLSYADNHSEWMTFYEHVLERYAEICVSLSRTPELSLEEIASMQQDCHDRFQQAGMGMRLYYHSAWRIAVEIDQMEQAKEYFATWLQQPRDRWCYTEAIELDSTLGYYLRLGDFERLRSETERLLSLHVSEATGYILRYCFDRLHQASCMQNDAEQAKLELAQLRRATEADYQESLLNPLLRHALVTGENVEAAKWFCEHWHTIDSKTQMNRKFGAAMYGAEFLAQVAHERPTLPVQSAPAEVERDGDAIVTTSMANWLDANAAEIGRQFDQRNGTDLFARDRQFWRDFCAK